MTASAVHACIDCAHLVVIAIGVHTAAAFTGRFKDALEGFTVVDGTGGTVVAVEVLEATAFVGRYRKLAFSSDTVPDGTGISIVAGCGIIATQGVVRLIDDTIPIDTKILRATVIVIAIIVLHT